MRTVRLELAKQSLQVVVFSSENASGLERKVRAP